MSRVRMSEPVFGPPQKCLKSLSFREPKEGHFVIQKLRRKCGSKYGLDRVSISCTTRVLELLKNELQNLTIDGLWFMRCGIHKS